MELRQRRYGSNPSERGDDSSKSEKVETKAARVDRNFTNCIFLAAGMAVVVLLLPTTLVSRLPLFVRGPVDQVLSQLGLDIKAHAVVLDAGSTGSRVLAFTFTRNLFDPSQLKLVDELWMQVKPGLSSFSDDPVKAGESIKELIVAAQGRIPRNYWQHTPITLKATAGLRLLPAEKSKAILDEVEKVLIDSGFRPDAPKLIEIMNPMEEGLFAWFTVNFLLGDFEPGKRIEDSHACLDLGGGSTQVIFVPQSVPVSGLENRKHFVHKTDVLGSEIDVYSHSYLGLGLMAARKAIFTREGDATPPTSSSYSSSCMPSSTPQIFSFQGNDYEITSRDGAGYESCLKIVSSVVAESDVHKPDDMRAKTRQIAAFSYYFDLAADVGLVEADALEGRVLVSDYIAAAKDACRSANKYRFKCVDLTFVVALLTEGYGLPADKPIKLYKKINGHEASWALGVGYKIIQNDLQ